MSFSPNAGSTIVAVAATSADAFVDSVGVNAHIDSGEPMWLDTSLIAGELSFLGVHNVRDGTPYSWALPEYETIARMGGHVRPQPGEPGRGPAHHDRRGPGRAAGRGAAARRPGQRRHAGGRERVHINSYDLGTLNSYGDVAWGPLDDANLLQAVRGDAALDGVGVVAASTSGVNTLRT